MTHARFNECLGLLHWDTEVLAGILGCNVSLTEACSLGLEAVPSDLSDWLETLAQVHELAEGGRPTSLEGKRYVGMVG